MKDIPYVDVDYCQFSDWGYKAPTRIWGCQKIAELAPKLCDPNTCTNLVMFKNGRRRHRESLGGNHIRFTPYQKGRFPPKLVDYLLGVGEQCQGASRLPSLHVSQRKNYVEEKGVRESVQIPPSIEKERLIFCGCHLF